MSSRRSRSNRTHAPTHALDHALAALARNDIDECLRRAVPVLDDVGSNAGACDLIGRAAVSIGNMTLACSAFETGARMLAMQGMATYAVAAALSVQRLTGSGELLSELADALGADAVREGDLSIRPPPLFSEDVSPIADTVPRRDVYEQARVKIDILRSKLPAKLPPRPRHSFWSVFPKGAFERFARALSVRVCKGGEEVIREGEHSGSVFIIARGEVRIVRRFTGEERDSEAPIPLGDPSASGEELAVLGAETVFGEMALLSAAPRAASAVTTRACVLLEAPKEAIDEATREVPAVGRELSAWGRRRLIENLLRTAPLLRDVTGSDRTSLFAAFEEHGFEAGDVIFPQDAEGVGLHLIASGRVVVQRSAGGGEALNVAILGPGDSVGEISLVLRRPTTAAVVAVEPTVAMVLKPKHFMEVVRGNAPLLASLYTLAVDREEQLLSVVASAPEDADDLVIM